MRRRALVFVRPNEHNPLPDLPIGSLRVVRCGIPDTYSSIPARMTFKGKTLRGYVSVGDGRIDAGGMRGEVFTFTPEADPARCREKPAGRRVQAMICGFCHATMPERDYVEHDIRMHDGLARTEDTHRLACGFTARHGGEARCFCRIEEYRRVARRLGRLT